MKIKVWIDAPRERKMNVEEEDWLQMSEKERQQFVWEMVMTEGIINVGWEEV